MRLEAIIDAVQVGRGELADIIGLDRSSMSKVLKGEKPFKPEFAYELCEKYGVTMDFIYRGQIRDLPPTLARSILAHLRQREQ